MAVDGKARSNAFVQFLGGLSDRQQAVQDVSNRRDVVNRLPEKFRTPEALARLNATLPPEDRIIDANIGEVALSGIGQATGALGDIVGGAAAALTPDALGIGETVAKATEAVMSTTPAQAATELVLDFSDANPRAAENLGNVFNVATAGVGGGLVKAGAAANKGAWAAGVKNYIDNFYTNDKPDVDPTKLEKTLGEIALKFKGQKINKSDTAMAGKRVTGVLNWGAGGAASALDSLFNPYSRGLYRDTGISRRGQKAVNDLLFKNKGKPTQRDKDKAVAQVIYNRHILEQSDRQGEIGKPLFEIEDFAASQGYKADTLSNFIKGANSTKFTTAEGKTKRVREKDLTTAYDKINKAWGNKPDPKRKVIFKEPSGGSSGNHMSDVARRQPAIKHVQNIIAQHKGVLTPKQFYDKLRETSQKTGEFKVNKSWKDAEKEGIWVQAGHGGGAIVEGGINSLLKVMPNGKAIAFMSDKHDFLEKMPIVGKALEKSLPNEMMAISGPMHMDLMGRKDAGKKLEKAGKQARQHEKASPVKRTDRPVDTDILQDYVAARPTAGSVVRGLDPMTGTGLLASTTGGQQEQ